MYSRLFADQWLQAYEFMDNNLNQREDKVLDILQRILRVTNTFYTGAIFLNSNLFLIAAYIYYYINYITRRSLMVLTAVSVSMCT